MKLLIVNVTIIIFLLLTGCSSEKKLPEDNKVKVGFVYVGPVGDGGWTYAHNQGRLDVDAMEIVSETVYIENVVTFEETEVALKNLVDQGCNVIFSTSFDHLSATLKLSPNHPDVAFEQCSGFKTGPNMGNYFGKMYQGWYLAGVLAGLKTENDTIGFLAAYPISECVRLSNSYYLGAKSVNPDIKMKLNWLYSWFSPKTELIEATKLVNAGCDVIAQECDSGAPQRVAEEHRIWSVGYNTDMRPYAPVSNLTSVVWDWGIYYKQVVQKVHAGTWKPETTWAGLDSGIVSLTELNNSFTKAEIKIFEEAKERVKNDPYSIFKGPLNDNKGEEQLSENESMSDEELKEIYWLLEGIDAKLPPQLKSLN